MSLVRSVPRRVRAALLPAVRHLPRGVRPGPLARLGRDARVEVARRRIDTDPVGALADLEGELGPEAPPRVWRLAAQAAARAKRHDKVVELDVRGLERRYAGPGDALRLRRAAVATGDTERAQLALDYLLGLTPAKNGAVRKSAEALRHVDGSRLPRLVEWRERIARTHPALDLEPVDEAILQVRLRDQVERGADLAEILSEALVRPADTPRLVRALMGARRYDDLEELLRRLTPEQALTVPAETWRTLAQKATSTGWSELAGLAAQLALRAGTGTEDPATTARLEAMVAVGQDEARTMVEGWTPPVRGSVARPTDVDPLGVVSVLGQSLPLRSGGYATRSHGILTSLVDRGWHMNAVTRLGFPYDLWWKADDERVVAPVDVVDGVPYHRLLTEGVRSYPRTPLVPYVEEGARGIAKLAREKRAGLIHASSLYDVGMAGLLAAREVGVPFVYEMRGLKQLLESARQPRFAESPRSRYLDLLEGTVAREADALFVITEALGRQMVEMGVDPERITVVPNGVNAARFEPRERDEELAASLGLAGRTIIGYVGGLVHYEGLDLLFEAVARLRRERDDFHVLVVGDGAHQRALHRTVEQLGVGDLVTFTGRVPHEEVEAYLSLVDITPFPRKPLPVCELISPIKPFESMAMEKAVVASDVAALAEIVQDGVTGRLFAKGDADDLARVLGELVDDPEQRVRLGRSAREWVVAERDWSRITDAVDGVYRQLLGVSTEE
ncbi:hypothetical protein GCM10009584_10610 [Ornithinimicrobium humiphilum]|uniref:D-inositol 3-phosphate glycosyltransferase n=1 Tax=Ornithinimicrobium humiphilum TaxID=125288 RepID=A0A543KJB3_9MICO|nr:glycosyltransferase family 4 protein [Ornithinimicrobium humiphilum]TQM90275.1 glycosyltransferase involved in cell wall biosynthesis [Ornithinimicrobium humiphilum]TQM95170.1 glycosyltransferase involved in cell wall biosynthesis [Ornithinimicrobium humiphilum]